MQPFGRGQMVAPFEQAAFSFEAVPLADDGFAYPVVGGSTDPTASVVSEESGGSVRVHYTEWSDWEDARGEYAGFDEGSPLARAGGKRRLESRHVHRFPP